MLWKASRTRQAGAYTQPSPATGQRSKFTAVIVDILLVKVTPYLLPLRFLRFPTNYRTPPWEQQEVKFLCRREMRARSTWGHMWVWCWITRPFPYRGSTGDPPSPLAHIAAIYPLIKHTSTKHVTLASPTKGRASGISWRDSRDCLMLKGGGGMVLTQGPGRPGCLQTHPPRTGRPQKPLANTPRLEGKEGSIWVFPQTAF